jgi:hypothetical protein
MGVIDAKPPGARQHAHVDRLGAGALCERWPTARQCKTSLQAQRQSRPSAWPRPGRKERASARPRFATVTRPATRGSAWARNRVGSRKHPQRSPRSSNWPPDDAWINGGWVGPGLGLGPMWVGPTEQVVQEALAQLRWSPFVLLDERPQRCKIVSDGPFQLLDIAHDSMLPGDALLQLPRRPVREPAKLDVEISFRRIVQICQRLEVCPAQLSWRCADVCSPGMSPRRGDNAEVAFRPSYGRTGSSDASANLFTIAQAPNSNAGACVQLLSPMLLRPLACWNCRVWFAPVLHRRLRERLLTSRCRPQELGISALHQWVGLLAGFFFVCTWVGSWLCASSSSRT